jgi:hypothetical protein
VQCLRKIEGLLGLWNGNLRREENEKPTNKLEIHLPKPTQPIF